jgi:hypothetical protein
LDTHGLTDFEIAHLKKNVTQVGRVGHDIELKDIDELRRRGVGFYLSWPYLYPTSNIRAFGPPNDQGLSFVTVLNRDGRAINLKVLDGRQAEKMRGSDNVLFPEDAAGFDRRISQAELAGEVANGSPWLCPNCHLLYGTAVVELGAPRAVRSLSISLDSNDRYTLAFQRDGVTVFEDTVPPAPSFGMRRVTLEVSVPEADRLRITATGGDNSFAIGHLVLQ